MDIGNLEPVARAICEREVRTWPGGADIGRLVDRYWPVVAAELAAGLIDDDGRPVPHSAGEGIAAWEDWLDGR